MQVGSLITGFFIIWVDLDLEIHRAFGLHLSKL